MLKFDEYIQSLGQSLVSSDWRVFLIHLLITAVLTGLLSLFYVFFGNALSNRRRFARNFLPLGLTTMLIIWIVKSSVALSLGLVGALSIVRFRAAIKDPEELTYLFLTIGIGLATGAEKPEFALIAFIAIVLILLIQAVITGNVKLSFGENMYLTISTEVKDLKTITDVLSKSFPSVVLRRVDESGGKLQASFLVKVRSLNQIETAKAKLLEVSPEMSISFVEQRNLPV